MTEKPLIDIVLATFNGEEYLGELIESLLTQTYENWRLILRDDASVDGTITIIDEYVSKFPEKIILLKDNDGRLGVISNFSRLLENCTAQYCMLCDQDDVWLPGKIELTLQKMKKMESVYSKNIPLLVYTDLKVVDSSLTVISESFWKYQKYDPEKGKIVPRTFSQNVAMGCSIMINKSLCEQVLPFPEECVIHDWWLSLAASVLGHMDYIPIPTMLYRQHKKNYDGARNWRRHAITKNIFRMSDIKNTLLLSQKQAGVLLDRHTARIKSDYRNLLKTYSSLDEYSFFQKRSKIVKNKFFKNGFLRNVGVFILT